MKNKNITHKIQSEMESILKERGIDIDISGVFLKINYAHLIYKFSNIFYEKPLVYKNEKLTDAKYHNIFINITNKLKINNHNIDNIVKEVPSG